MLDACTVCGLKADSVYPLNDPNVQAHLAHPTPVCGDCDACTDFWGHDDLCPQAPLPEVISLGDYSHRWMVASGKVAPGAYWPVAIVHVNGGTAYRCECPFGQRYAEMSPVEQAEHRGCRHIVAVVRHCNQLSRRPSMPVNVAAWCD